MTRESALMAVITAEAASTSDLYERVGYRRWCASL
jgi:hypothetical protein